MRVIFIIFILLWSGCIVSESDKKEYEDVRVRFTVWGGAVTEDRYFTEYLIENGHCSLTIMNNTGGVTYHNNKSISADEMLRIGENIKKSGVLKLMENISADQGDINGVNPNARMELVVDDEMNNVSISPLVLDYIPSILQSTIFDVRRTLQDLQEKR